MDRYRSCLHAHASQLVEDALARINLLSSRIAEREKHRQQGQILPDALQGDLENDRESEQTKVTRFDSYEASLAGGFPCPWCWIEDDRREELERYPEENRPNAFYCNACHLEIEC